MNVNHVVPSSISLILILVIASNWSSAQSVAYLDPNTATRARAHLGDALDGLGELQQLILDDANWLDATHKESTIDRVSAVEERTILLDTDLEEAISGGQVVAGEAFGGARALFAYYEYAIQMNLDTPQVMEGVRALSASIAAAFDSVVVELDIIPPMEICNNGVDDDGDKLVDENDPDCQSPR